MKNTVITSVKEFIDIDGYGACIAYRELLKDEIVNVYAVTNSLYNESISGLIKQIPYSFDNYSPIPEDEYIVLDVSNPAVFDECVNLDNVIEVIDHRLMYKEYWKDKVSTKIEYIGAVCTIIYEIYKERNKCHLLNKDICKLLVAGILDNTLGLKASITTNRDINAYNELLEIGTIDKNWFKLYFESCEEEIKKDLNQSLINDMRYYPDTLLPELFGQLLVFNKNIVIDKLEEIKPLFNEKCKDWILNVICIEDGKSYIVAEGYESKKKIEKVFSKHFIGDVLILDKFMLRKEILEKAREKK